MTLINMIAMCVLQTRRTLNRRQFSARQQQLLSSGNYGKTRQVIEIT
jgi:hypothetical protein